MAENPLIGKQISLISKKNIRYLGTLYSINEQNATVALQNVKSFGTEGRPAPQEVAPSNDMHPFLLFRGQDITDLHVHEEGTTEGGGAETAAPAPPVVTPPPPPTPKGTAAADTTTATAKQENDKGRGGGRGRGGRGNQNRRPRAAPGTGASLLHRPTRGGDAQQQQNISQKDADFDFQSNLEQFQQDDENDGHHGDEEEDEAGDEPPASYEKDDFFDSISCEATDRQSGVDNRLRGRQERDLNTETFGAVALSQSRRRGGRGRGGRGGRGGGRGGRGGRGRGRGGRGRGNFRRDEGMPQRAQSAS
uniref:DFDF domain-containing protein n=1 Tax=Amphora coffeiformis TaxID=265554 RepID=A0A7S3L9Q7_9STRA